MIGRYSTARVLDAWYAACRSDDLRDGPIARAVLDQPLVLFRESGGAVDEQGRLACLYHGWRLACIVHSTSYSRTITT